MRFLRFSVGQMGAGVGNGASVLNRIRPAMPRPDGKLVSTGRFGTAVKSEWSEVD
jgi:hypothetical protein